MFIASGNRLDLLQIQAAPLWLERGALLEPVSIEALLGDEHSGKGFKQVLAPCSPSSPGSPLSRV
jgi:hypothetical protein